MKKVGKTGGLPLLYFEVVSTLALVIGLVVVKAAAGGRHARRSRTRSTPRASTVRRPGKMQGTIDFLLNVIPTSVIDAFAKGNILQVLLFSVLFGFALHAFGERGKPVFELIDSFSQVLFGIINMIMKVARSGLLVPWPSPSASTASAPGLSWAT